jgi:AraC-like DNA-binding protein
MLLNVSFQDILQIVPILGCVQGYIFCIVLMTNKKLDWHKSIFLCAHLFSASSLLLLPVIEQMCGWKYAWTADALIWISVPSTYFYMHMFSHPERFKNDLLHLLLLATAAYALEYWFFEYKAQVQVVNGAAELLHSDIHLAITIGKFLVFFGYFYAAVRLFRQHQLFIKDNFSNTKHYDLKWVRNILVWNELLIGYALVAFLLTYVIDGLTIGKSNMTAYWAIIIYIYYASINGFRQKDIHIDVVPHTAGAIPDVKAAIEPILKAEIAQNPEPQPSNVQAPAQQSKKPKYLRNKLADQDARKIIEKVIALLENEELYLEPELTLQHLSDKTKEPTYLISQALNQSLGKSFYDLVNNYRVEKAMLLLRDPNKKHLTILSIAFEAGFNSKTTFNNVFKKLTGSTPTEYMKTIAVP